MLLQNNKTVLEPEMIPVVRNILLEYLEAGFIKIVDEVPYCVLPLQVKVTGNKTAIIYDMSPLNVFVEKSKFKLEGWEEMLTYCLDANFSIKFDLKKFYHEIDLHVDDQKYFGFMYVMNDNEKPKTFVWRTMPYGYTRAPFIARSLMKPLIANWRRQKVKIIVFYDDGMAVHSSYEELKSMSNIIHSDLVKSGLIPGVGKCIWEPVQCVDWNGLRFDFVKRGISILPHRIEKTLENAKDILAHWPNITFRKLASFEGQIISMHAVFEGLEQLRSKMIQTLINIRHYKNLSWEHNIVADYGPMLPLGRAEIERWLTILNTKNFRLFEKLPPEVVAWVDASDVAVAALAAKLTRCNQSPVTADNWLLQENGAYRRLKNRAYGQVDLLPWLMSPKVIVKDEFDLDPVKVEKLFTVHRNLSYAERAVDSNERELLAAVQLVESCGKVFTGKRLTVHFDNMNAASIVQKGSNKPRLQRHAEHIANLCEQYRLDLHTVWIPRDLNNVADMLSKQVDYEDYSITSEFFQQICELVPCIPVTDCFANNLNAKTKSFFSNSYCPGTLGVNCFNYDWKLIGPVWLFPPPRLIGKTVAHLKTCNGEGLLLVPQWENAYFYPLLMNLSSQVCLKKLVFEGKNVLRSGTDSHSFFGPEYKGNIEIYWLNFGT
jgi:Reverse transcriptase (RNA-dependent DNA polymerase)/RNase H-like domain found in reverse transcriptase